jgi:hypothetical protein
MTDVNVSAKSAAIKGTKKERGGPRFQSKRWHAVNAKKARPLLGVEKPHIKTIGLTVGVETVSMTP